MRRTDQARILIERAQNGEKEARDILFQENTGLIYSVLRRFMGRGVDAEDLFQIGSIGLLKAIEHFDFSFEVRFSTYAVPMIAGEIKRFLRDDGMVKISRSLKENYYKIQQVRVELYEELGREATIEEVCEKTQIDMEELLLSWGADNTVDSIYKTIYQNDGSEINLIDKIPEKTNQQESMLNKIYLEELLASLLPEERKLIYMRYFQDKTQTEIAGELGISQVQVSRAEKKILRKMREEGI